MIKLPVNRFKKRLRDGDRQVGLFMALADPYVAEIVATAQFDWIMIDAEHGPNDVRSILQQAQVLAAYDIPVAVRPSMDAQWMIKQLLDIGVQTLVVPMVDTPEQAARIVSAAQYPPKGIRGVGTSMARAARWNGVGDYLERASDEICIIVQAETKLAVSNLEAIAEVPGVDAIFVGPSDLAADMGKIGEPNHPDVQAVVEDALLRIVASGKSAGVFTGTPEFTRRAFELGCGFVACGSDAAVFSQGIRSHAERFKATANP